MKKRNLTIGILLLFIFSIFIPITLGYNMIKQQSKLSEDTILNISRYRNPPVANFTIQNNSLIGIVKFDGSLSYDPDGEIVSYEWDFGDGAIDNGKYGWHQYCIEGTYDVTLTVTDNDGLKGNLTKSVFILLANIPPPSTTIYGPQAGSVGTEYEYTFHIEFDDDYEIVFLMIDWGDGNTTDWIGPYFFWDDFIVFTHSWSEIGTYIIKGKAKDLCREGSWGILEVTMPKNKALNYNFNQIEWSFERFPNKFPLLKHLLEL